MIGDIVRKGTEYYVDLGVPTYSYDVTRVEKYITRDMLTYEGISSAERELIENEIAYIENSIRNDYYYLCKIDNKLSMKELLPYEKAYLEAAYEDFLTRRMQVTLLSHVSLEYLDKTIECIEEKNNAEVIKLHEINSSLQSERLSKYINNVNIEEERNRVRTGFENHILKLKQEYKSLDDLEETGLIGNGYYLGTTKKGSIIFLEYQNGNMVNIGGGIYPKERRNIVYSNIIRFMHDLVKETRKQILTEEIEHYCKVGDIKCI